MHTREISVGQNTLRFETGKLAKQAHGSVIVRLGDSVVLVTACHSANPREGIDFLPLTVDYREYTYARAASRAASSSARQAGRREVLTNG
jgi:polyribonucleotide nucleotidyltransferase